MSVVANHASINFERWCSRVWPSKRSTSAARRSCAIIAAKKPHKIRIVTKSTILHWSVIRTLRLESDAHPTQWLICTGRLNLSAYFDPWIDSASVIIPIYGDELLITAFIATLISDGLATRLKVPERPPHAFGRLYKKNVVAERSQIVTISIISVKYYNKIWLSEPI